MFLNRDLQSAIDAAELKFKTCGYDDVSFHSVDVRKDSFTIYFNLEDDFQSDAHSALRYLSGYMHRVGDFNTTEEFLKAVYTWPSREKREIKFLLRRFGGNTELAKQLQSIELREFIDSIQASISNIANQLEHMPETELGMTEEAARAWDK